MYYNVSKMPTNPINYANTIIYKIVCNDLSVTDCYVGHTTDFIRRKAVHKSHSINEKSKAHNYKLYKIIRENGGWSNWSMIEIEKCTCANGNEARAKEREWYEKLNSNLNTIEPTSLITKNERAKIWYETHKEKYNVYQREYQKKRKDLEKN